MKSFEKLPEKGEFVTSSGIPVNRIYTPLDVVDVDYLEKLRVSG